MKTKIISAGETNVYLHALDVLRHGGMVAFPTDTVYGLATLAFDEKYVDQLYIAKGRSHNKAIAILLGNFTQVDQVAKELNVTAKILANHYWPGPLTLIVEKHPQVPLAVSSLPTIGLRIPNNHIAIKLFEIAGPLAVTSANLSNRASATTAQEVLDQLGGRIHLIIDGGKSPGGVPSTIVDCTQTKPKILREGPITMRDIKQTLQNISNPPILS